MDTRRFWSTFAFLADDMTRKLGAKRKPLMHFLDEIDDPRTASNGTLHDFQEILVISSAP